MNRCERLGAGAVLLSTLIIPNFVLAEDSTTTPVAQVSEPSTNDDDASAYLTLVGPCSALGSPILGVQSGSSDKAIVLALEADSPASVLERLNAWVNKCGFRSPDSDSLWVVIDTITSPENPDKLVRALRIWAFGNITGAKYLINPPK